ncbi:MAG TPA: efflux RND transporter permease subunit [Spirochaetia bacterium]|nr:efflux RND transporter permease subunit [Spirochaetia bacterium]
MKKFFYRLVEWTQHHAWIVVGCVAVITVVMAWLALHVKPNPDMSTLTPEDPAVTRLTEKYGAANKGEDYLIIVARGPALFQPETLARFSAALDQLSALPHVHPGITPFNFPMFETRDGRLGFGMAAEGGVPPSTVGEADQLRQRLLANPQALNLVISPDGSSLAAYLPADSSDDDRPLLKRAEAVIAPLTPVVDIRVSGMVPFSRAILDHIYGDLPIFLGVALVIILLSYYLSFRTKRSLFLPVLIVVLGTIWTVGTMTLLGFKLTIVMVMTPPLVLILGSSYSLHMLNQYYRDTRGLGRGNKDWIVKSVTRIAITIFLAAATTVLGFLSLLTASLRQVREFGVATAIGITYCALLALFFLPAVLSKLPPPTPVQTGRVREGPLARMLVRLATWVTRRRWVIVAASLLTVAAFALALTNIRYQTDFMKYFRYREPAVENYQILLDSFTGFETVYLTLNAPAGATNYFQDPSVLATVARLEDRIRSDPDVKYMLSFNGFLRNMNQAISGSPDIPRSRVPILLLSRYVAALSATQAGKAIAGNLVSPDYTRYTIQFHVWDHVQHSLAFEDRMAQILPRIDSMVRESLPPGVTGEFWGGTMTILSTSAILTRNQVSSIVSSALLVFLIATLIFRSVRHGLVVLIPLGVGLMLDFIFMGIFSIRLDVVTITFASIAIGIGVDNAIHLVVWYRRLRLVHPTDPLATIQQTMKIAGRPMILTTVSIAAALLVFLFSAFKPVLYFGILIAMSLVLTTAASLIVLPVFLYFGAVRGQRPSGRSVRQRPKRRAAQAAP